MADPLQLGFSDYEEIHPKNRTGRQRRLDEMEATVPWEHSWPGSSLIITSPPAREANRLRG